MMQSLRDVIFYIDALTVYVQSEIDCLEDVIHRDDLEASRADIVDVLLDTLRLTVKKIENLPSAADFQIQEQLMAALHPLYNYLAIFEALLREASAFDEKHAELVNKRQQLLELEHHIAEEQKRLRYAQELERELALQEEKNKTLELEKQSKELERKNSASKFTLEDLTTIFVTHLTEITPELLAADRQKQFLELYTHLRTTLLQANQLSREEEPILTDMVLEKFKKHLKEESRLEVAKIEQTSGLSEGQKLQEIAMERSRLRKKLEELDKALSLFKKG